MYIRVVVFISIVFSMSVNAAGEQALSRQIDALRVELLERHQRIEERLERLERLLATQYSVKVVPAQPSASTTNYVNEEPEVVVEPPPLWKNPEAWARIKPGMNRAQVEAILGPATKERVNIIDYVTLLYKDEEAGVGSINGSVTLTDTDRVEYRGIRAPNF